MHESIYDEMCNELTQLAEAAIVGDGSKQDTQTGPLQNRMKYEKVKGFLEDARKNGTIVAGGEVMDRLGFFIRPMIVRDITEGSRLVDEEQFGPLLPVLKYASTTR
jgi:acyl-CoA reductase-like NAD-dependent aldehyde dehydrogenase